MKKIISIFAIVFALTMVMTVSAFAAGFAVDTASLPEGVEVVAAADSLEVTIPATEGAEYSIVLVNSAGLPTSGDEIAYIDQLKAEEGDDTVTFNVLPLMGRVNDIEDGSNKIYIGSNVKDAGLIQFAVTYEKPAEEPTTYMVGDVDGDTSITIGDVTTLIDKVLERIEYFTDSAQNVLPFHVGDVDNDESVTIGDVTTVIDRVLERITSFPRTSCELPAGTTAESTYPVE